MASKIVWLAAGLGLLAGLAVAEPASPPTVGPCKHVLLPMGTGTPIPTVQGVFLCYYEAGAQGQGAPALRLVVRNGGSASTAKQLVSLDIYAGSEVLLLSLPVEVPPLDAGALGEVWVPMAKWPVEAIGWQLGVRYTTG